MFGLNPYLLGGAAAAAFALLAFGGGYIKGDADAAHRYQSKIAAIYKTAQDAKDAEAARAADVSTKVETKSAEARIVYRTITRSVDRVVDRPVYRNVCLDGD